MRVSWFAVKLVEITKLGGGVIRGRVYRPFYVIVTETVKVGQSSTNQRQEKYRRVHWYLKHKGKVGYIRTDS